MADPPTLLESAADVAEIGDGDFEERFGVAGSVLPVPPVTLRQFFR